MHEPNEARATEPFLSFGDFGFDDFADQNEGNEDYKIFDSRDAFTTKCNVGNGEGQVFANSGTHSSTVDKRERR